MPWLQQELWTNRRPTMRGGRRAEGLRLVASLAVLSCAGAQSDLVAPRTEIADPGLRQLVIDSTVQQACERMKGRWIGIAKNGSDAAPVAERANAPVTGRFYVARCEQRADSGRLWLKLGGPGWQWVDVSLVVHGYVYFNADAQFSSALELSYDAQARVASMRLEPVGDVVGSVSVIGVVGDSNFLVWFGDSSGRKELTQSLASGATLTYDVTTSQLDTSLGQLPAGVTPRRPFAGGARWLVNERQQLRRGGFQISGPFDATGPRPLAVVIEDGPGVDYFAACESDVEAAMWTIGEHGPTRMPTGPQVMISNRGRTDTWVSPPYCSMGRWVLVTMTAGVDTTTASIELLQ